MIAMILFRLDVGTRDSATFTIRFNYCLIADDNAFVRKTRRWVLPAPALDGFAPERYGTSETRGVMGGVKNERLRAYSEDVERAIGTATTACVAEILDVNWTTRLGPFGAAGTPELVLVLGPALPKSVGRIASLRPPGRVKFVWITPARETGLHYGIADIATLAPPVGAGGSHNWSGDSQESLVRTTTTTSPASERWIMQTLTLFDHESSEPPGWDWAGVIGDTFRESAKGFRVRSAPTAMWLALWQLDATDQAGPLLLRLDDNPLGGQQWSLAKDLVVEPDIEGRLYSSAG